MIKTIKRGEKIIGIIQDNFFLKNGLENRHLMGKFGATPGIDKKAWEDHKDDLFGITITTKKGNLFISSKKNFEEHSFTENFGFGDQLFMLREHWTIK